MSFVYDTHITDAAYGTLKTLDALSPLALIFMSGFFLYSAMHYALFIK